MRDASSTDRSPWPDEPSGIIIRSGGSSLAGVWGSAAQGGRVWWIEFDEGQVNADGDGPYATAQVHERFLELAPPIEDLP